MSTSVLHDTIVTERQFDCKTDQVFQAWSSEADKRPWFANSDGWENYEYRLDFRVGGQEYDRSRAVTLGFESIYDARYEDIVDNQRIVCAYTMTIDGKRLSSSLLTLEFSPTNDGTLLRLTEQIAAYGSSEDIAKRLDGWRWILGNLDSHLHTNK